MNFLDILRNNTTIGIIGTGKNAGKTVALNEFINIASKHSVRIGITSIGRDGERQDIVTFTEKPPIFVPRGTFVATAEMCLSNFDTEYEIIDITPFQTAMGRVIICEVVEDGFIEIAGPDSNSEIKRVCGFMRDIGADRILIDGALNRKTLASPAVADAVVLSTGAVLSRSMEVTIQKTKHYAKMLCLEKVNDDIETICREAAGMGVVSFIDKNKKIINTKYITALGCGKQITGEIKPEYEYVVLPGTLTSSFIKSIRDVLKEINIKIVVMDGTKVFLDAMDYKTFERLGGRIQVVDSINLAAVTVNPYSPEGYCFDPVIFVEAIREALYPIDVFDCMQGGC
ncbi:MAG: hypothetical protein K0R09_641 [Clostridiales bacterium]|nr:hypothetical protein [Clostridiales bacterium]